MSTYIPSNQEYKINKITDIIKVVNEENIDLFLEDFRASLLQIIQIRDTCLEAGFDFDSDFQDINITWLDDGKHEIDTEVKIIQV